MAVVPLMCWVMGEKRGRASSRKAEKNPREEIKVVLSGTPSGLWRWAWRNHVSVTVWACEQERFQPRRTWHTHIQTRVRRPPTPDTGRVPGADTWSVVRRQVRQESGGCLLATCQSLSLLRSSLFLPHDGLPRLIIWICICFSHEHSVISGQIQSLATCFHHN